MNWWWCEWWCFLRPNWSNPNVLLHPQHHNVIDDECICARVWVCVKQIWMVCKILSHIPYRKNAWAKVFATTVWLIYLFGILNFSFCLYKHGAPMIPVVCVCALDVLHYNIDYTHSCAWGKITILLLNCSPPNCFYLFIFTRSIYL